MGHSVQRCDREQNQRELCIAGERITSGCRESEASLTRRRSTGWGNVSTRFGGPGETIPGDRGEGPAAWPFSLQTPRRDCSPTGEKRKRLPQDGSEPGRPEQTPPEADRRGRQYEAVEEPSTGSGVNTG